MAGLKDDGCLGQTLDQGLPGLWPQCDPYTLSRGETGTLAPSIGLSQGCQLLFCQSEVTAQRPKCVVLNISLFKNPPYTQEYHLLPLLLQDGI